MRGQGILHAGGTAVSEMRSRAKTEIAIELIMKAISYAILNRVEGDSG